MKTPRGFYYRDRETGIRYNFEAGDDVPAEVAAQIEWLNAEPDAPDDGDLMSLTKPELVAKAEAAGVDASGTKADIVERLA